MEESAHYISFLNHIKGEYVHPEYAVMVRNGRAACKAPPIQQTPRTGGYRELFIASPEHLLVAIDYKYIELCTLAAVCESRYQTSVLANVIRQNLDPHCFTASIFEGVDFDIFMSWKNSSDPSEKQRFTESRQKAKAINFGIPSGLTAIGLCEYAKSSYGVPLTSEESEGLRHILINHVYPELGLYLKDCEMETLAKNLGTTEFNCWKKFSWKKSPKKKKQQQQQQEDKEETSDDHQNDEDSMIDLNDNDKRSQIMGGVRNIIRGKTTKKNGKEYNKFFVNKVWNGLQYLVTDSEVLQTIKEADRNGSELLFKKLLGRDVCTLTGRIRGKVGFTQACNTAFSGLASDGAKLAMWKLTMRGHRLVGFIHDEILVEIPESSNWDETIKEINEITCSEMSRLTGTIPISCEYSLSRVWSKEAKAIFDENNRIMIWEMK
eukprot:TRINITY_DN3721_c0_g1_i2.p1 TRINITY_DN3721_c0_g1~~TRINITY_DN3721_c0_g1_i2.p1  ORF type:complete len:435 (+),score=100.87 TRINITY_DN3721_c0_g1_i2:1388-2692(+)